ncbi:HsdR family type I site-specific deoxyribonuclease [Vibrio penaeicida]|uniref:type I restriction endonuclease subunit R, EcoR124 family n=1 Tax=Vibrio penaeicida TaxID=104609 RepID=UPI002737565D|nr:HsdR family type I site-specific deoxyribonuclease [Vibrio penaeicida]MDP2570788.1 HsdR family type I site-specific deoxyribonuclease [Vibrio penaeicida]
MNKYGLPTQLISQIQTIAAHYPEVEAVVLYGSRAKGSYREGSDIDLTLKTNDKERKNLLLSISNQLEELDFPYQLDISLFRHLDNPSLIDHIERVGIELYNQQSYQRLQKEIIRQKRISEQDELINMSDNTTGYQSEAQLEESLLQRLIGLGYERITIQNSEELRQNLKQQLERHNKIELSGGEFNKIVNFLDKGNVFGRAKTLRDRYNLIRDDGASVYIQFFNTLHWCQNQYQVTSQVTQQGNYQNRYDVTLLVNGLPLVQVELKRRGVELKEAFNQINRYQRHSYWADNGLFNYVQLFVISNGVNTKYYANNRKQDFKQTFFWADEDNNLITQLDDFADAFLERCHVSKMIAKYIVLHESDKILMVLRPYQYYAAETIADRVKQGQKHGYIWHTTGSGKTLTSFKAAQLLTEMPKVDKVVFVVDRADLDYQTTREFNYFSSGSVDGTNNTKALVDQMAGKSPLIITTIQKLNTAIKKPKHEAAMQDLKQKRVVFIFDECHRSQFGETHKNIVQFFEKAQMFGFTGTPIFKENAAINVFGKRTTKDLFQKCLHKYVITNAIADENVLKFSTEYWGKLKRKDGTLIDEQVAAINKKEFFENPDRLESIVDWVIQNHTRKTHNRQFSAVMCVSNVDMLIQYYDLFKKKKQQGEHDLRVVTCFTYNSNEPDADANGMIDEPDFDIRIDDPRSKHSRDKLQAFVDDYNVMYNTKHSVKDSKAFYTYYKDIAKRMKERDKESFQDKDRADILLVVNMYLTGFDAKKINTLYVDKNLKYHGLIQAYSRTNRILGELKSQGNIVCFRNLKDATDQAIKLFCDTDANEDILMAPYEDYVTQFNLQLQSVQNLAATPQEVDNLIDEEQQLAFVKSFRQLIRTLNKLKPFADFDWQDLNLSEQMFEDYKSKYLDIYDRARQEAQEAASILEEVDFELELIHRDEINVAYILKLLGEMERKRRAEGDSADTEKARQDILAMLGNESQLRSKRDLIERFIDDYMTDVPDTDDLSGIFSGYWHHEKRKAIHEFCQREQLDKDGVNDLIEAYLFSGKDPLREQIFQYLAYKPKLMERKKLYDRLLGQLKEIIHKYEDDTGSLTIAEDPEEYSSAPLSSFAHRVGDRAIYFSDEVRLSSNVKELARFSVKLNNPYEQNIASLVGYEPMNNLLARGVISDEMLTNYIQITIAFQQNFTSYYSDIFSNEDERGHLFWSLSEVRKGSEVYEFVLNYWHIALGTIATTGVVINWVMNFLKNYPQAAEGFEHLKADLKKEFRNEQKDVAGAVDTDISTSMIITEDLEQEFKKLVRKQ